MRRIVTPRYHDATGTCVTSVTIILFEKKIAYNFIFLSTDRFLKDQKALYLVKITTKHASNSHVTIVTQKCFAVLLFLPLLKLTISGWQQNQRQRLRQGERHKTYSAVVNKTTTSHVHHPFCTFLSCGYCCGCKSATWNFLISRVRFMELVNTAQKKNYFLKLRYGPFGFNPRQFRPEFTN